MKISDEKIILIAKSKGHFSASARHRDMGLRRQCDRLCKDGQLYQMPDWKVRKQLNGDPRSAVYYAPAVEHKEAVK